MFNETAFFVCSWFSRCEPISLCTHLCEARLKQKDSTSTMGVLPALLFSIFLFHGSFANTSSVAAFAAVPPSTYVRTRGGQVAFQGTTDMSTLRKRTSPAAPATAKMAAAVSGEAAAPAPKKARITSFDSMRGFLITCMVLGHFIKFANPPDFVWKFFSQHNVLVGGFFALSGYVMAYTSTEVGKCEASPKLLDTPKQKWILSRVFGYYPLHLFILLLFSPLFLFADVHYNGWAQATFHGILSATLTQAWFPMHAEVWNPPTWFLSALAFTTIIMPFSLPSIAKMNKKQLRKTAGWLWLINLLPKIGYAYDFNAWKIVEGIISSPKAHPNWAMFNVQRFTPLMAAAEVLLGAVACRLVMLDGEPGGSVATNALSTLVPLIALVGVMTARAMDLVLASDLLVRALVFIPLFLRFLMAAHRNTVNDSVKDPTVSLLSNKVLVALGNLSFPIYIAHGPIGQLFYKKLIANKLFGGVLWGPQNFGIYLATTVAMAWILQQTFLKSKAVNSWSSKTVDQLSSWM